MMRSTYEGEGPQCPCCGRQYTADEACYYDEQRYTEETCDECGETFDVEVCTSVNWRCTERLKDDEPCPDCGGAGERFDHADDCDDDDCALAGGMNDCNGQVVPCHCSPSPCSRGVL